MDKEKRNMDGLFFVKTEYNINVYPRLRNPCN